MRQLVIRKRIKRRLARGNWALASTTTKAICIRWLWKQFTPKRQLPSTQIRVGLSPVQSWETMVELILKTPLQVSYFGELFVLFGLLITFIGPGAYKVRSEFDLNKYIKELDDRGTYLTIENGHLNQKRQLYSKVTDKRGAVVMKKLKDMNITPGPGAYETNDSSVIST